MNDALRLESEKLVRSWAQYDASFLRDYLVADVEDPRLNIQSILSRHFLLAELFPGRFAELMLHEVRFATVMNWLNKNATGAEERSAILHALRHGADNAEGQPIPHFVTQTFAALPANPAGLPIPNYLAHYLGEESRASQMKSVAQEPSENSRHEPPDRAPSSGADIQPTSCLRHNQPRREERDLFLALWREALAGESPQPVSVLEPACGSANDYRFLAAGGIARLIEYTGFDLCEKNVANARALFPDARFETGNVFDIAAPDQSCDLCFTHDLLEHLSSAGLERAVQELCRVTRHGLCVHFFRMDEIADHFVRPIGDYHVNTLSLARTEALFVRHGFAVQPLHIGSYLRQRVGCEETHNPNAYTFLAFRR